MNTFTKNQKIKLPYSSRTTTDWVVRNNVGGHIRSVQGPVAFSVPLNKPATKKNPPDATGWRKPSNFHTLPSTWGPRLYGVLSEQRIQYYPTVPSWHQQISIGNCLIQGGSYGLTPFTGILPGDTSSIAMWPLDSLWSDITWQMEQEVRVQALASLANRKGKILETFAELRSSVRGLARNAEEISWFIDNHRDRKALQKHFNLPPKHPALKRMRRIAQTAKGTAEFFGRQWLNFWFGLAPIVDDMVFVALILSNPDHFNDIRVKGNGHKWFDKTYTGSKYFHEVAGGYAYHHPAFHINYKVDMRVGIRLSAYYKVEQSALVNLKQYGMLDVASTAWAIAPLSWMVDWVFPVTKILESYEALAGLSFKGGTMTRYYIIGDVEMQMEWENHHPFHYAETPAKVEPILLGGKGFDRKIVLPMGMLPAPYIKDPLGLWTATTALSFMAQKLKGVLNFNGRTPRRKPERELSFLDNFPQGR